MKRITLLLIVVVILFVVLIFPKKPMPATQHTNFPPPTKLKVIGWIPNWDQGSAITSYETHIQDFSYVSVFWYRIDSRGRLTTYLGVQEDPSLIAFVHQHGEKIFALVANLPDSSENKDWDPARVQKIIGTEAARQKHVADLVQLVEEKEFDGVDIDYESLKNAQRSDFSMFIQELAEALHDKGKLLGVATYPPSLDSMDADYGPGAQDVVALAQSADQLYFMTYLEHTLSSDPGPTGSFPWVKQSITYALDTLKIPKEKIFMGIGLMGTAWRKNTDGSVVGDADDLTFADVVSLVQENVATPSWDNNAQSPFVVYSDQNGQHIIWYENSDSVKEKISLAQNLALGGIAFWRLGNEDDGLWQYVK